jgi:hypothetical protein
MGEGEREGKGKYSNCNGENCSSSLAGDGNNNPKI